MCKHIGGVTGVTPANTVSDNKLYLYIFTASCDSVNIELGINMLNKILSEKSVVFAPRYDSESTQTRGIVFFLSLQVR